MLTAEQRHKEEMAKVYENHKRLKQLKQAQRLKEIERSKETEQLKQKLEVEQEKGEKLSANLQELIKEIIPLNIDSKFNEEGQRFLSAENQDQEQISVRNLLKIIKAGKASNPNLFFQPADPSSEKAEAVSMQCPPAMMGE